MIRRVGIAMAMLLGLTTCCETYLETKLYSDEQLLAKPKSPSLPQHCEQYRRTPDPKTWNPKTETYPRNIEWEKCIGVR